MFCENGVHGHCSTSFCKCPVDVCIRTQHKTLLILKDVFSPYKVNQTRIKKSENPLEKSGIQSITQKPKQKF